LAASVLAESTNEDGVGIERAPKDTHDLTVGVRKMATDMFEGKQDGTPRPVVTGSPQAEILTAAEVARYLHCSKAHVYNAINGKIDNVPPLPALMLGRRRLVRRAALESWIRANETCLASGMMPSKLEMGAAGRVEKNHATTVPGRKFN
jgi:excisionase family DNA binding protein